MRTLDNSKGVVIALGYFDSLHIGHREVIKRAKKLAEKLNAHLVVFTFAGNLRATLNGQSEKYVYTLAERQTLLKKMGVDSVYFAPISKEFLSLTSEEFLDKINSEYKILGYACGDDYRFGKNASGNVDALREYAKNNFQQVEIVGQINVENERVSTSLIKQLLGSGNIERANQLLGENYFVFGKVVHDRGVGKKLGFPTANINVEGQKQVLKSGVYAGKVLVDNCEYNAVINCGNRPTFSIDDVKIEAHIIDFDGDLYEKEIKIVFNRFIREIFKFNTKEELINQLKKDMESVGEKND